MKIVRAISGMRRLRRKWQKDQLSVGLVPTMGYLHEGHLSLFRRARKLVGNRGKVVVSIYVNPTQFAPNEDFTRYPRDFARDAQLCRAEGVDAIFAPGDRVMYPSATGQEFSTFVVEEKLSRRMEGASRPTHFRGVTTIVAKLFNIIQPDVAVFGAKDYQQAAVIKRMVRDLDFPLRIVVAPIVREADGLAMSSRNKYLKGRLRGDALALRQSLKRLPLLVKRKFVPAAVLKEQVRQWIEAVPTARLDYVEFFDTETLEPVETVKSGVHVAIAAFVGRTRLIDNLRL